MLSTNLQPGCHSSPVSIRAFDQHQSPAQLPLSTNLHHSCHSAPLSSKIVAQHQHSAQLSLSINLQHICHSASICSTAVTCLHSPVHSCRRCRPFGQGRRRCRRPRRHRDIGRSQHRAAHPGQGSVLEELLVAARGLPELGRGRRYPRVRRTRS